MPPTLALILALAFILWLFRRDVRGNPTVTWAVWLPITWAFVIGSRPVSQWLHILGLPVQQAVMIEEGSPLDAFVFFLLIAAGLIVLLRRRLNWSQIIQDNAWLAVFILYCLLAVCWSDFQVVSLKRWIKILGHPIMVLVLFTEPHPIAALLTAMKRCAYVLFPVSILWMKYYPALGRKASEFGGMTNSGIAGGKNELGAICMLWGLFFVWHFLTVRGWEKGGARRNELRTTVGILLMIGYCLYKSHSSTSEISFVLGASIIALLGLGFINLRMVGTYAVAFFLIFIVAQLTFDVFGTIVNTTGRSSTIEGRERLWQYLLQGNHDQLLGVGFESYWLGQRLQNVWALPEFRWHPTQAHNGYLETYINLGGIGLVLLGGLLIATFAKCKTEVIDNFAWGRFRIGCFMAIAVYNWTEAAFKALHIVFFAFFLIAITVRWRSLLSEDSSEAPKVVPTGVSQAIALQ